MTKTQATLIALTYVTSRVALAAVRVTLAGAPVIAAAAIVLAALFFGVQP